MAAPGQAQLTDRRTPAERHMVAAMVEFLREAPGPHRVLNVGAGKSTAVEDRLIAAGVELLCDRADVIDCRVDHPAAGECRRCSVEDMTPVESNAYRALFANYVLEHVHDAARAAGEIFRVLAPGGRLFVTIPNPSAPEHRLARWTPTRLHRLATGRASFETRYDYGRVPGLVNLLGQAGLVVVQVRYDSFIEGYLGRWPGLGWLGRAYDRIVTALNARSLMGNVCLVMEKPA